MDNVLLGVSGVPCNKSDFLRIAFFSPDNSQTPTVQIRYLFAPNGGKPTYNSESVIIQAGTNTQVKYIPLTDGILITVTLSATGTTFQNGQLYAAIGVQKGDVNTTSNIVPLISGYVSANGSLNYPQDESDAQNSGLPAQLVKSIGASAPGTEINDGFANKFISKITGGCIQLITDGSVLARQIQFILVNGSGNIWAVNASRTQAASLTVDYYLTPTPIPLTVPTLVGYIPIPHFLAAEALTIQTATTNLSGGDLFTPQQIFYEASVTF